MLQAGEVIGSGLLDKGLLDCETGDWAQHYMWQVCPVLRCPARPCSAEAAAVALVPGTLRGHQGHRRCRPDGHVQSCAGTCQDAAWTWCIDDKIKRCLTRLRHADLGKPQQDDQRHSWQLLPKCITPDTKRT